MTNMQDMHDDEYAQPEDLMELFLKLLDKVGEPRRGVFEPLTLQDRLAAEGNTTLIANLNRALRRESGYETIAIPKEGFSEDDETHNTVLDWLKEHDIHTINPIKEIAELEKTLYGHIHHDV